MDSQRSTGFRVHTAPHLEVLVLQKPTGLVGVHFHPSARSFCRIPTTLAPKALIIFWSPSLISNILCVASGNTVILCPSYARMSCLFSRLTKMEAEHACLIFVRLRYHQCVVSSRGQLYARGWWDANLKIFVPASLLAEASAVFPPTKAIVQVEEWKSDLVQGWAVAISVCRRFAIPLPSSRLTTITVGMSKFRLPCVLLEMTLLMIKRRRPVLMSAAPNGEASKSFKCQWNL